uniref:Homeobox domain-containing protein n=1 Tax=Haemonchus placei TaxID=6290 RepID=A0A0N4W1M6_HAEPC
LNFESEIGRRWLSVLFIETEDFMMEAFGLRLLNATVRKKFQKTTGTSANEKLVFTESPNSALKRRFRTNFTEAQSLVLEEAFQESHYPDQTAKKGMAEKLDIPEDRITVNFFSCV